MLCPREGNFVFEMPVRQIRLSAKRLRKGDCEVFLLGKGVTSFHFL